MLPSAYGNLSKYTSSVGLLVDRCVTREQSIGTVWLVDTDKVATCAHSIILYGDFLRGLKVRFPSLNQDWEVVQANFHPQFDQTVAAEMALRSLSAPVPALALQNQNLAILTLSRQLSDLPANEITAFNKKVSLAPLPRIKGLAGSVEELGLALVLQTVSNARKDGILVIADERNRPIARFFYRDGKIVYAKYGKLSNEIAIYQMFQHDIAGQFHLNAQSEPDWEVRTAMARSTDSLLLEAHRRMDDMHKLASVLGSGISHYMRVNELFDANVLSEEARSFVGPLWPFLDGGVAVDQLWEVVNLDTYSVYTALAELKKTGQLVEVPISHDRLAPLQPLEMAAYEPLSPWDEVVNLSVHAASERPQLRRGSLVGLLRPNDPYHLLHNLALPYKSAGSPLFKKGKVVGMHCGMLPLDPVLHALPQHLQQMLWVDSVQQCLYSNNQIVQPKKKSVGMRRTAHVASGTKTCQKCNSVMVKEAVFCGICGQKL